MLNFIPVSLYRFNVPKNIFFTIFIIVVVMIKMKIIQSISVLNCILIQDFHKPLDKTFFFKFEYTSLVKSNIV